MSDYLDRLEAELRQNGVASGIGANSMSPDDNDLKIIMNMQKVLGVEYSDEQKAILKHRGNSVILACAGSGKALVNGTGVLTPNGYKAIETLKHKDIVYDHTGLEQIVLGVYPQGKKQVYRVYTNTGDYIPCCSEHLWTVLVGSKNDKDYWMTVTTEELCNILEEMCDIQLPNMLDIYDGNYNVKCSSSYYELVKKSIISYNEMIKLIKSSEPHNDSLISLHSRCWSGTNSVKSMYNFCMAGAYNLAQSESVKNVIKTAYEYFGMSTCYENNREVQRRIVKIEITNQFEEMTCIKVTGLSELFLTEHCIPTHNTTISTHLIAKRIMSGEIKDPNKLLYVTYSKAGADEMKLRMQKVMQQLGYKININVRTLHSFFNKLIQDFGNNKTVLKEYKKFGMIAEACKESGFTPKDDDINMIISLMGYQINNLLGDEKTFECVHNNIENLTLEQYTNIRKLYSQKKQNMNVIDFDDMQFYIYTWAVAWGKVDNANAQAYNKAVLDYCRSQYTDFYIDEAQDVGKIQFEIIKAIVTDPSDPNKLTANFTFIGDDDQAIYSWRGSDPSIIQGAGPQFNIKNLVLSTNYRCKNEIVDFATTGIKCNNIRYEKGMNAYQSGGSVKIRVVADSENNLYTMSKLTMQQIQAWIKEGNSPDDIAVLCRNNKHLSVLSIMLLNESIFYNGTEEMRATKGSDYSELKMIVEMCEPCWKAEIVNKLFWKFNRYLKRAAYTGISKFMSEAGLSIEDALWYICKKILNKNITEEKHIRVGIEADKKVDYAIRMVGLSNTNLNTLYELYLAITTGTREERLNTLIALYKAGMDQGQMSLDKARISRTLLSFACDIAKNQGFDALKEFLRVAEQFESGTMGVMGEKITLSTVHSAKGREWKNVIMFACDNLSEPSFSRIRSLKESDKTTDADLSQYIDEERRLFYVGSTRAKENLILLTSMQPSVFILDSLGLGVTNQDIIKYALNNGYGNEFKEEIQEQIISSNSKYSVNK